MNISAITGDVLTVPKTYRVESGESMVFLLIQVAGIKEAWDAKTYDETIPVTIPFKILGTNFNHLSLGSYVMVSGALQKGRYLNLQGAWEITVGIAANEIKPLDKERFLKNKEAAMKNLKGEYSNE